MGAGLRLTWTCPTLRGVLGLHGTADLAVFVVPPRSLPVLSVDILCLFAGASVSIASTCFESKKSNASVWSDRN
uniref:Putative secreted protein n=1 Tax=Anopheles marajoara TaxID=58244 RepID=A0A2M4CD92_9DIPT